MFFESRISDDERQTLMDDFANWLHWDGCAVDGPNAKAERVLQLGNWMHAANFRHSRNFVWTLVQV